MQVPLSAADEPDAAEVKVVARALVMAVEAAAACYETAGKGLCVYSDTWSSRVCSRVGGLLAWPSARLPQKLT